jgi:hypothetical protein
MYITERISVFLRNCLYYTIVPDKNQCFGGAVFLSLLAPITRAETVVNFTRQSY